MASASDRLRRKAELAFGVVLPLACFALDHYGHFHVYGGATNAARLFVLSQLGAFAVGTWIKPSGSLINGLLTCGLATGAIFAAITGICLLPSSIVGSLGLIGLLGFVPFGTALAYAAESARAFDRVLYCQRAWPALVGGAFGVAISVTPFCALRNYEQGIGMRAQGELASGSVDAHARAWKVLRTLPACDIERLPGVEFTTLLPGDLMKWSEFGWYEELASFPTGYW